MYSKMLGIASLPFLLSQWIDHIQLGFVGMAPTGDMTQTAAGEVDCRNNFV